MIIINYLYLSVQIKNIYLIRNNNAISELISLRYYLTNESTDKRKTTELSLKVPFCNDR